MPGLKKSLGESGGLSHRNFGGGADLTAKPLVADATGDVSQVRAKHFAILEAIQVIDSVLITGQGR